MVGRQQLQARRTTPVRFHRGLALIALLVLVVCVRVALATPATYYVDYTNGLDSNNGTSKSTPWKNAPGMWQASGLASSTTINPGDSIVLKGCVTWPNNEYSWYPAFGGSAGNSVNVGGLDQTWWDNTVSGCATSWNRPILDLQGAAAPRTGFFNALFDCRTTQCHDIFFSNVELKGLYAMDGPINHESIFFNVGTQGVNLVIDQVYVHGWVSPYFALGTGNVAASSGTITNFVPSYTQGVALTSWTSQTSLANAYVINPNCWWACGNNYFITSITATGGGAYTIVTSNSSHTNAGTCTGCFIQLGIDFTYVFAGNEGAISGYVVQNSVIDGSDTLEAQLNPYTDCGASEGNNNWCGASGVVGWHVPNVWRDNVIRYNQAAMVGECTEWSGNLIEDIRFSTDPSAHTNGIECLDSAPISNVLLKYGNVFRHTNVANASTPQGRGSIGLPVLVTPQGASTIEYDFDNVAYDTLQNSWLEMRVTGTSGSVVVFNNSSDGGPSWSLTYPTFSACPSGFVHCTFNNNHSITGASNQFGGPCGSNCSVGLQEVVQPVATAAAQGYTETTTYAFLASGATVGAGANLSSLYCTPIAAANANAGAACLLDTPYAVSYDAVHHKVIVPARTPLARGRRGARERTRRCKIFCRR